MEEQTDKHPQLHKTKAELYRQIIQNSGESTQSQEAETALYDMMLTALTSSIDKNASSADKLTKQIVILNFIMTIAAIIAVVIGIIQLSK